MVKILRGQLKTREIALITPTQGMDDMIRKEYIKGEVAGIQLSMCLPKATTADFEDQLEQLKEVLRDERERDSEDGE